MSSNKTQLPESLEVEEYPYLQSEYLFDLVATKPWSIFLDSGARAGKRYLKRNADYDVLAIAPSCTLIFDGESTLYQCGSRETTLYGDPLAILQSALPTISPEDHVELPYLPGALGYFSYDLARQFENLPELAEDQEQLPPMAMGIYKVIVLVDHSKQTSYLISIGDSPEVQRVKRQWIPWINKAVEHHQYFETVDDSEAEQGLAVGLVMESMNQSEYRVKFNRVRDYTIEGDCYQVNLTKQFSAEVQGSAWETYKYLRNLSPAPYGAFMNFPFARVLSNSPESFIQCRDRIVATSPIKGTRPRDHADKKRDDEIATSLTNSEKDRAENLMIVDLMRNDLSRCCELGSVKVPKLFELQSFANVHHLVSTVTGVLKPDLHSLDLLRSCFPGGSITGAPKIRSMEIIEELEPNRRGLYCGSIGYLGVDGSLETNIAIRTIVIKDGIARFSAGGGLVIDSNAEDEYEELNNKASMMRKALIGSE